MADDKNISIELSKTDWEWLVFELDDLSCRLEESFHSHSVAENYKLIDRSNSLKRLADFIEKKLDSIYY